MCGVGLGLGQDEQGSIVVTEILPGGSAHRSGQARSPSSRWWYSASSAVMQRGGGAQFVVRVEEEVGAC